LTADGTPPGRGSRGETTMHLGDVARRNATYEAARVGIVFGAIRQTWQEVDARANRLANGLASLGLSPGDRVAVLARNSHRYLETYFAVAKAGLVTVPLNYRLIGRELASILADCEARALLAEAEFGPEVDRLIGEVPGLRLFVGMGPGHAWPLDYERLVEAQEAVPPAVEVPEDSLSLLSYTSGTTGRPKGVMLSHRNLLASGTSLLVEYGIPRDAVWQINQPLCFVGCLGSTMPSLLRGARVVVTNFEPRGAAESIARERVTHTSMVPTMVRLVCALPDVERYDLSSLQRIFHAAAPMPVALRQDATRMLGDVLTNVYGLTESAPAASVMPRGALSAALADADPARYQRRLASVGKPAVNVEMRVARPDGSLVPAGSDEVGELVLRGPNVMLGYWKQPRQTAEALRDGWLHTGDLGRMDEDGFFYVVDRSKDMIITGGINVYSSEVEEVLYQHPAVAEAAVIGVPDEQWGESVKAIVALRPGEQTDAAALIEHCRAQLGAFKVPRTIDFLANLPKSDRGKILKHDLREGYWTGRESRVI
jgi:long-chain acyl-CoA synthetase